MIEPDSALARPRDVTHWRCRRADGRSKRGTLLSWDGAREWSIDTLSPDAIPDRWGPGDYVVEYVRLDAGARQKRGRSPLVRFGASTVPGPETHSSPIALTAYWSWFPRDRAAAADARRNLERHALDLKADLERYRLTLALRLERERLESRERIARIEAASRPAPIVIHMPRRPLVSRSKRPAKSKTWN